MCSSERNVEFPVELMTGELVTLHLTQDEAERASRDQNILLHLVETHMEANENLASEDASIVSQSDSVTEEDHASGSGNNDQDGNGPAKGNKQPTQSFWTDDAVLLLLAVYKEKENVLNTVQKPSYFWKEVSEAMTMKNAKVFFPGEKCSVKMSGLKRTYKTIIDHNSKSGNDRKTWKFFDIMDDIFGKKPWVNPVALASEAGSLIPDPENESSEKGSKKKRKVNVMVEQYIDEARAAKKEKKDRDEQYREKKFAKYAEHCDEKLKLQREKIDMQKEMMEILKNVTNSHQ